MRFTQVLPICRPAVAVLMLLSFIALRVGERTAVAQSHDITSAFENQMGTYEFSDFHRALDRHDARQPSTNSSTVRGQSDGVLGLRGFLTRRGAPSLEEPGPDSPDFPDTAFTVAPGIIYVETSGTYESSKGPRVRDYFTDTLIRVGLWENWELRISSPGVVYQDGVADNDTGFGPLTFGFKKHIWEEDESRLVPAFGIIAQVTTATASAGFDNGAAEPTIFFNFDHTLPAEFAFEWNAGISWLKGHDGERFVQGEILWALGRELCPNLEGFVHGIVDFPALSGEQEAVVIGPGLFWLASDRIGLDASYNFGLTGQSPHRIVRLGLSMAF